MKKLIISGAIGAFLVPILLITVIVSPLGFITGTNETEEHKKTSFVDIAVFGEEKDLKVYENYPEITAWLGTAQAEIKELRSASAFKYTSDDEKEAKTRKSDAKERATAFYLEWYMDKKKSPIPAGQARDWNALADCFMETALTEFKDDTKYSIDVKDKCWKKIESLYGISIKKATKTNTSSIYEQIHSSKFYTPYDSSGGIVGDLFDEDLYPENSNLRGDTAKANEVWNRCFNDSNGGKNFTVFYGGDRKQCTDIAHWRFWSLYQTDWSGAGNGMDCAHNVASTFYDESHVTPNGYYFVESSDPTGGAIFSVGPSAENYYCGHVGMIEKVDGDNLWYTDGNVLLGGVAKGVRVNVKTTVENFKRYNCKGACTFAVPQKTGS